MNIGAPYPKAATPSFGFGAPATTTPSFGAPGGFGLGAPAQAAGGFGAPKPASTFGGGGGFGFGGPGLGTSAQTAVQQVGFRISHLDPEIQRRDLTFGDK